jgi:hypothetical protein
MGGRTAGMGVKALIGRLPTGRIPVGGEESLRLRDRDRVKCGSMREGMQRRGDLVLDLVGLDRISYRGTYWYWKNLRMQRRGDLVVDLVGLDLISYRGTYWYWKNLRYECTY